MNLGETAEDAAVREAAEELGLRVIASSTKRGMSRSTTAALVMATRRADAVGLVRRGERGGVALRDLRQVFLGQNVDRVPAHQ